MREELIKEYGAETVRSGGLRVYTTVNRRYQRAAEKAIRDTLYYNDDPASAIVSIDPSTGAIRAMTAITPGRTGNQFNLAAQSRRQSGSTFKTFVLATAVAEGVNPDTTSYVSAPLHYQPDPYSEAWDVATYSHSYSGSTSISRATLASDNTVYARMTLDLGPEKVAQMAHRLGVRSSLKAREGVYVPSLGLGAMGVSPLDMSSAYATLAAGGVYSEPMAIRKVELAEGGEDKDAGWGKPRRRRVIADWVAETVTDILEQNIQAGTGTGAAIGRTAAGKTGTTEEHSDAWFCGYTPNLSTTVWVGYPQAEIPMTSVHGISVAGGTFPAQIWRLFMGSALDGTREWEFPEAEERAHLARVHPRPVRGRGLLLPLVHATAAGDDDPGDEAQADATTASTAAGRPASASSGRPASATPGRAASAAGSQAAASAAAASWLVGDAFLSPRSRRGLPCWRS